MFILLTCSILCFSLLSGVSAADPKTPVISMITKNAVYCTTPAKETGCSIDKPTLICIVNTYATLICSEKSIADVNKKINPAMTKCFPKYMEGPSKQMQIGIEACFAKAKTTCTAVVGKIDTALDPVLKDLFTKVKESATKSNAKCGTVASLLAEYTTAGQLVTSKLITDLFVAVAKTFDCTVASCINQYFSKVTQMGTIKSEVNKAYKCNIK